MLALLAGGCFTDANLEEPTESLALTLGRTHDAPIRQGGVRIAPSTSIRFVLDDGAVTNWVEAGEIHVSAAGVSASDAWGTPETLPWSRVRNVQARTLNGPETLGAVVLGTVAVAVVVLAVVGAAKSGGSLGGCCCCCGGSRGGGAEGGADQAAAPTVDWPPELFVTTGSGNLFTASAERRDTVRLLATPEAGLFRGGASAAAFTFAIGAQFRDLLDVQGEITYLDPAGTASGPMPFDATTGAQAPVAGTPSLYGFGGRLAVELPMDFGRHVLVPLGVEAGRIHDHGDYVAADYGIELSLGDDLALAVRPYNAEYVSGIGFGWLTSMSLGATY